MVFTYLHGCSVGCGVGASVRMNLHTQTSQQSPLLEVYAHTRQTKSALSPRTPGVVLLRVPAPGLRKRVVALPSGLVLLLVVLVVLVIIISAHFDIFFVRRKRNNRTPA